MANTVGNVFFLGKDLIGRSYLGNDLIGANPATYVQPNYVTSGAVLILDAGNTSSYPGTGTTWFDLSGYNNNADMVNMAANYVSSGGGYFNFPNNPSDYMSIASQTNLNASFAGDFTWDLWLTISNFYAPASNQDWTNPFSKGDSSAFSVLINRDTNAANRGLQNIYGPTSISNTSKLTLSTNTWFNWQVVRSSGVFYFYQNTTALGSGISDSQNYSNTNALTIGKGFSGASYPFDGHMGFFAIYNRALSGAELSQNYNFIKTRYGL
jgi:hypothetical protein